jgi:hypothetical protein
MFDTPTLQCKRVSFYRCAVVQNGQQIFEFASIGHGAAPAFDHRPAINSGGYLPVGNTASLAMAARVLLQDRGDCRSCFRHLAEPRIDCREKDLPGTALSSSAIHLAGPEFGIARLHEPNLQRLTVSRLTWLPRRKYNSASRPDNRSEQIILAVIQELQSRSFARGEITHALALTDPPKIVTALAATTQSQQHFP